MKNIVISQLAYLEVLPWLLKRKRLRKLLLRSQLKKLQQRRRRSKSALSDLLIHLNTLLGLVRQGILFSGYGTKPFI